jgi:DNA-binding response OmpR family regulator
VLTTGDLTLDPAKHVAQRAGLDLNLTKKEFGVLEVLLSAEGRVVSAEELLEKAWDENADPFTNVVRVTIMTLRRKLGDPPLIETIAGVGYKI